MTPPCYTFPATELTERVQLDVQGRQRKMKPSSSPTAQQAEKNTVDGRSESTGGGGSRHQSIDLARDCTLLSQMVQYSCAVMHPEMRDSPVRCWPVQRMFRRCQDKHGSFIVETTAWEGTDASRNSSASSLGAAALNTTTDVALGNSSASSASAASAGTGPPQRPEALRVFG